MRELRDDDNNVLPPLNLSEELGWRISSLDLGFPTITDDMEVRVQANGMYDYTRYYGERTATMEGIIFPPQGVSRQSLVDRLAQYCNPSGRYYLHWQYNDDEEARCVQIRGKNLITPNNAWNRRNFQAQWVVAKGVMESSQRYVVSIPYSETQELPGRIYARTYPRTYPAAGPQGTVDVYNGGNEVAWPIFKIYGGVVNPIISNPVTGEVYDFVDTIPVGNYLEIDTANALVLLNGDINDSRYDSLQDNSGAWWGLRPGINQLQFSGDSTTGGNPQLEVIYRYAYL